MHVESLWLITLSTNLQSNVAVLLFPGNHILLSCIVHLKAKFHESDTTTCWRLVSDTLDQLGLKVANFPATCWRHA